VATPTTAPATAASWIHGDFDHDDDVDLSDLGTLATFNCPGEVQASADFAQITRVPEADGLINTLRWPALRSAGNDVD
jgi:hypothetical protein